MRVAIVQHQDSVPPGLIEEVLEDSGIVPSYVHAWNDETRWPDVAELDALVVMGGTMNVDQLAEYPMLERSRTLMRDAIESGVATLGVCLGSQMMARVLGSEVRRAEPRNALFSRLELTPEGHDDPLVGPFADCEVLQFHEDTFTVPDEAVALAASSSSGLPQAFRYGDRAYAIQFHFEVDRPILEGWLHNIGKRELLDEWGCSDEDLLQAADRALAQQSRAGKQLVERFVGLVATTAV